MLLRKVEQKKRPGRNGEQPIGHEPELNRKAHYANTAHLLLTLSEQQTKWLWGFPSRQQYARSEGSSGHCMRMHPLPSLMSSSKCRGAPKDDVADQFVYCEGFLSLCQIHFHH